MSLKNIENNNFNLDNFDLKESLKKGNIEQALCGLQEKTRENLGFKKDLCILGLKINSFQKGKDGEKITSGLCSILDNFLHKKI